ncbi:MurR/RpiR family transcriptional regulator [Aliigemmobacter aestuarii]|uniref:MurR/RpiR family transcriptional regulator n=1 Tax=Aliigemmobacter aestuarii TaxID=1445661 RepID=A0A4V3V0J6_9RHOB|nr:MurR/RpiR family transcriptional regulator [Gemmobacter aestuarii]THD84232.1 MurR/RpiR family transcriptional regulator [Gemmobacter aestuarii]
MDDQETADRAPTTVEEFHERLAALADRLPKRLRQCAEYIGANADRIAVSTVAELAAGADVPPSAVMRFCQIVGFSGFSEMQRLFREAYAPVWPDYATRLQALKEKDAGSPAALLGEFIEAGRLSLEALAQSADEAVLNRAVSVLSHVNTVHVVGFRRAFPVASYLAYVFEKMSVPSMLHDGLGQMTHRGALRPGDGLLAITFPPYSRETLSLAEDARARGLAVVALTDRLSSPLATLSDAVVPVPEVDFGSFRSLSATIAVAMALAVAIGTRRGDGENARP